MNNLPKEVRGLFGKHRLQLGIGDLARVAGVSQSKIRYWEQKGYVHSIKNDEGQNHKYSLKMLGKISLIKHFMDEGFTLQAAAEKAEQRHELMDVVQKIMVDRFIELTQCDGHQAINLGPLDDDPQHCVFAVIENDQTKLRLVPTKN